MILQFGLRKLNGSPSIACLMENSLTKSKSMYSIVKISWWEICVQHLIMEYLCEPCEYICHYVFVICIFDKIFSHNPELPTFPHIDRRQQALTDSTQSILWKLIYMFAAAFCRCCWWCKVSLFVEFRFKYLLRIRAVDIPAGVPSKVCRANFWSNNIIYIICIYSNHNILMFTENKDD